MSIPNNTLNLSGTKRTTVTSPLYKAEARAAKIETVNALGPQMSVRFQVIAREASFTDTTIANYNVIGAGSSMRRYARSFAAERFPALAGELTAQFESVTPKVLSFDIMLRADRNFTVNDVRNEVIKLQSMCYPRGRIALNPPLVRLTVLNLYSLECYVTQVLVTWTNSWDLREGYNLPMGADINLQVLMHQYPTYEQVLGGGTFFSQSQGGYSGVVGDTPEDQAISSFL